MCRARRERVGEAGEAVVVAGRWISQRHMACTPCHVFTSFRYAVVLAAGISPWHDECSCQKLAGFVTAKLLAGTCVRPRRKSRERGRLRRTLSLTQESRCGLDGVGSRDSLAVDALVGDADARP